MISLFQTLIGEYKLVLRKSYITPLDLIDNADIKHAYNFKIYKKNSSAKYILVGGLTSTYEVLIAEININVGSETEFIYNKYNITNFNSIYDNNVEFLENDYNVRISCICNKTSEENQKYKEFIKIDNTTLEEKIFINLNDYVDIISIGGINNIILNQNESYITIYFSPDSELGTNAQILLYHIENNISTLILSEDLGTEVFPETKLKYKDENIYFLKEYADVSINNTSRLELARINNNDVSNIYILENGDYSNAVLFYIFNVYNLFDYVFINGTRDEIKTVQEIYNQFNYNGLDYENETSLIPNSSILKNNDDVIFARNLYNKTINNNETVSTLEIQNYYLNDIDITQQKLLSLTNTELVDNTETINKNIYERVLLNFVNIIKIKDNETNTLYANGASKLNFSINTDSQYENGKIGKIKIIYTDDTYEMKNITNIDITNNIATIESLFYAYKVPKQVQILSNDETAIYLTKDLTTAKIQKTATGTDITIIDAEDSIATIKKITGNSKQNTSTANKQLFDKNRAILGAFIDRNTGGLVAFATAYFSDYILVNSSTAYKFSGNEQPTNTPYAWYDINKTYISGGLNVTNALTSPSNARYIRFTINSSVGLPNVQLEQGTIATSYIAFNPESPSVPYPSTINNAINTKNNNFSTSFWQIVNIGLGYPVDGTGNVTINSSTTTSANITTTTTFKGVRSDYFPIIAGKTYTVKAILNSISAGLRFFVTTYNSSKVRLTTIGSSVGVNWLNARTFIATENGFVTVAFASTVATTNMICNSIVLINETDNILTLTSSNGINTNNYPITLPNYAELPKLSNGTEDTIEIIDNVMNYVKRVSRNILVGSGSITDAKTNGFYMCDITPSGNLTDTTFTMPVGGIYANIYYELATPVYIPITLPQIQTYKDYTVITSLSNPKANLTIKYNSTETACLSAEKYYKFKEILEVI